MPKPTTCLTCSLPRFARAINDFSTPYCKTNNGEQLDDEGHFATAAAKTYQPRFCGAISASIAHAVFSSADLDLSAEIVYREVRALAVHLAQDYEQHEAQDFISTTLPPSHSHHDEIHRLLEWDISEHTRGADFTEASLHRR